MDGKNSSSSISTGNEEFAYLVTELVELTGRHAAADPEDEDYPAQVYRIMALTNIIAKTIADCAEKHLMILKAFADSQGLDIPNAELSRQVHEDVDAVIRCMSCLGREPGSA